MENKTILVTGGTGSFGKQFIKKILTLNIKKVIVYSRDELKQSKMMKKIDDSRVRYFIGNIRDVKRFTRALNGVDIVVHAAALKQVPALEYNPEEAIKTNVIGAMNIIEACSTTNVKKVIALSTDKAAQPVNLYGATKLCSDKLFIAANSYNIDTKFAVVRYGNVFGSRGSIIPVLHEASKFKVTDPAMTRFNLSLQRAVDIVINSVNVMTGGELFVPKLKSYTLADIVKAVDETKPIKIIGKRPGEKMHEKMICKDDAYHTVDCGSYYIIEPTSSYLSNVYQRPKEAKLVDPNFEYVSNVNDMHTVDELKNQYQEWKRNT